MTDGSQKHDTSGGEIWVESEGAGQGTTFFFRLPSTSPLSAPGAVSSAHEPDH